MNTQLINKPKNDIHALRAQQNEIAEHNIPKSDVMAEHDLDIALTMYADHLTKDYFKRWNDTEIEGKYSVTFERGRKFMKVLMSSWGQASVHSFICIQPHGKFQFGDILKAASWAAPAKNFARGNVLDTNSYTNHRWTGG